MVPRVLGIHFGMACQPLQWVVEARSGEYPGRLPSRTRDGKVQAQVVPYVLNSNPRKLCSDKIVAKRKKKVIRRWSLCSQSSPISAPYPCPTALARQIGVDPFSAEHTV